MDRKTKILFVSFLTAATIITGLYWFLYVHQRYPEYQEQKTIQILVLVFIYILSVLPIIFDSFRKYIFKKFAFISKISPSSYFFLLLSLLLSVPLLVYFINSSKPDDNILPATLKFNIIEISAVLGGLVLAAAAISQDRNTLKKELVVSSRYLLLATIVFIFSTILAYNAYPENNDLATLQTICKWAFSILYYVASTCFFMGIFKLLLTLFRFSQLIDSNVLKVKVYGIRKSLRDTKRYHR